MTERLDFQVAAGELVSVSGGTRSDLLWAIAGLGDPGGGTITIDGEPIAEPVQALAAGVALIPQGGAVASLLTAYENVLLPLTTVPEATPDIGVGRPTGRRSRERSNWSVCRQR